MSSAELAKRMVKVKQNGFTEIKESTQLAFYVNLYRAVIGPSATLTGRWRPDIDLRRMLTGKANILWDIPTILQNICMVTLWYLFEWRLV